MVKSRIRPGVTLDFESIASKGISVGTQGIATMAMQVNWGEDGKLVELTKEDIFSGKFSEMFGDTDILQLELMFIGCSKVLFYPINKGVKASITIDTNLTVTAKYGGTFGNNISVGVEDDERVVVYVNGKKIDEQEVSDYNELIENEYVTFSGTGSPNTTAFTKLVSGTNGSSSLNYEDYYKQIITKKWNVIACNDKAMNTNVISMIKRLRDDEEVKVQAVMVDDNVNYEGVIKLKDQNVIYNDMKITSLQLTCYVAGISAGAGANRSNTNLLTPFSSIVEEMTNSEIEIALLDGYFLFTYRANRKVKCESDINSLTEFTDEKNKDFSKNRIIRTLDLINNDIKSEFQENYLGKVDNDDIGRDELKGALIDYFKTLQKMRILQDFDPQSDIKIVYESKNSIYSEVLILPVDAMEHLRMLVKLR